MDPNTTIDAIIAILEALKEGSGTNEKTPEVPQVTLKDFVRSRGPVMHKEHQCTHCDEVGHNVRTCTELVWKTCPDCGEMEKLAAWNKNKYISAKPIGDTKYTYGEYLWYECSLCNYPYNRETHEEWKTE